MQSIAARHGFADGDFIWNHPNNDELRKRRASPNVLAPGDVVFIPDRTMKVVQCATGMSQRFVVRLPKRAVHVVLRDGAGAAIANSPYVLRAGDVERKGRSDSDGVVHEAGLRPSIDRATLELTELGITRVLLIGHLDPHDQETGWRQRLANLGYDDDKDGLAQFRRDQALPEDADEATVQNALYRQSKA